MGLHKKRIQLAGMVTLGPKGQIVIPSECRELMGIVPGDKLVALYLPDRRSVGFVSERDMQQLIDDMGSHVEALKTDLHKNKD